MKTSKSESGEESPLACEPKTVRERMRTFYRSFFLSCRVTLRSFASRWVSLIIFVMKEPYIPIYLQTKRPASSREKTERILEDVYFLRRYSIIKPRGSRARKAEAQGVDDPGAGVVGGVTGASGVSVGGSSMDVPVSSFPTTS